MAYLSVSHDTSEHAGPFEQNCLPEYAVLRALVEAVRKQGPQDRTRWVMRAELASPGLEPGGRSILPILPPDSRTMKEVIRIVVTTASRKRFRTRGRCRPIDPKTEPLKPPEPPEPIPPPARWGRSGLRPGEPRPGRTLFRSTRLPTADGLLSLSAKVHVGANLGLGKVERRHESSGPTVQTENRRAPDRCDETRRFPATGAVRSLGHRSARTRSVGIYDRQLGSRGGSGVYL
jgi:hypothetical protein